MSVKDIALAAGVSIGTVSNVLNRPDRVAEETVERVRKVMAEHGFVRNDAARQLRAGRSRTIGLVLLDARNPFFMDVARGAESAAAEHGLSVVIANSDGDPVREAGYLDYFEEQRAAGILLSPTPDGAAHVPGLVKRGTKTVLVDTFMEAEGVRSVIGDDVMGGRLAVEHLLSLGRRNVAFVGGPTRLEQVAERLRGAREVAAAANASLEVIATPGLTVEAGRRAGYDLASRPSAARPDAVFAANDLVALGLIQALAITGRIQIPEHIAIIGYDDIDFAAAAIVPLSSIRQPAERMGQEAVKLLVGSDATEPTVRFEPELVARASTLTTSGSGSAPVADR